MIQQQNTIDRPHRTRGNPSADGDFIVYEHVAIFDQHVGDDGVEYDERLLRCIAENCNKRIRNTGDWCPIVLAHTRDQEDKAHVNDDPPVLGLAGPFYVSDFVNSEGQTVKAIYTTMWVFAEDDATFRKNPRRSVEIWPEDKPENRYFDPLTVLGAETPKRDLGLIYSRGRPGYQSTQHSIGGPFRYSKRSVAKAIKYQEGAPVTTPGGNNTFIPGGTKPKKPIQHAKGITMPLAPEDISQIIEALKPTIQSMIDATGAGLGDMGDDIESGLDAPGGDLGLDASGGPPGLDAPGGSPEMPMDDGIPSPDGMDDDSKLYARGLGRKFMKYFKADGDLDDKGAEGFMGSLDDDDKKHLGSYMKYMCDDDGKKQKYAARYAKSPLGGTDMTEKAGDSKPSGSMNAAEMKGGEPERYSRGSGAQQYTKVKKERDEAVIKYSKLHADHESLKIKYAKADEELGKARTKERYSKRESSLLKLSSDYAFDVEDELELTDDFNDSQFERHCERVIPQRYSKVSGSFIPTDAAPKLPNGQEDKSQRFAGKCRDAVQKYRKAGRSVEYGSVMRHLIENNGDINEDKLFATNGNGKH
jgi:hypothetical protein